MAEKDLKTIQAVEKPEPEIGIDVDNTLTNTIIDAAISQTLDIQKLEQFTNVSQRREIVYGLIDSMSQDSTVAAVLETYTEDTVETNEQGKVVWVESSDTNISDYVSYLIDDLNIDKNIYEWANKLIKYGDVYLRLYRESDEEEQIFDTSEANKKKRLNEEKLEEKVNINVDEKNSHYVHYVECIPNPGEMFELDRMGKTMGFIKAPTAIINNVNQATDATYGFDNYTTYNYRLSKNDIDVFQATDFVHGCLFDDTSRVPEEVSIFLNDTDYEANTNAQTYSVKRGKSLLADSFKIWRELSLLEDSILLNRLTKSSLYRIIQVNTAGMNREAAANVIRAIKNKLEQKTAYDVGTNMQEYNNPGPVVNNVYLPVAENGNGAITPQTIGGDYDPKQLTDLSYFQDKLFGAFRVPKQFFGVTDDSAGFNGGTSLAIISSRYGKAIKRIQLALCNMITDLINLFLFDAGLLNYVNRFTIRMQSPITQEELDKRQDISNRLRNIADIMQSLDMIESNATKLKIVKTMLSSVISDTDINSILEEEVTKLEEQEAKLNPEQEEEQVEEGLGRESEEPELSEERTPDLSDFDRMMSEEEPIESETEEPEEETEEETLPSASELGQDFTINQ